MRLALWTPPPVLPVGRKVYAQALAGYRRNGAVRGIADGITALLGLLLIDGLMGCPVALRMLYVVPVWLVGQRAGRFYGILMVLVTAATMTAIDHRAGFIPHNQVLLNLLLHGGVLYGLMRIMEEMEARVRAYSTLATRDALTGAANRLALDEFARRSVERSNLTFEPLAIGMVDCDRFKQLNDAYGHAFGDLVLKTLTKCLTKALPPEAMVARTGGDEFVIVLPGRSAHELRRYLDSALVRFLSSSSLAGRCVGFSFGTSSFGVDRKTYQEILLAADADMYLWKANHAVVEGLSEESVAGPAHASYYRAVG